MICVTCGVGVQRAASGRLVHTEEIPRGKPFHEVGKWAEDRETYERLQTQLRSAEEVRKAKEVARGCKERMQQDPDIMWTETTRSLVILLDELDRLEYGATN